MTEKKKDDLNAIASATEVTGAVPAIPWDGDTEEQRKLHQVHRQGKKTKANSKQD